MKQQKIALIVSALTSIISLITYFISVFLQFTRNDILKDISLAILSSAVFVVVISWIGYFIEKKSLQRNILENSSFEIGNFLLTELNSDNSMNRQIISRIIKSSRTCLLKLKSNLICYNKGLFFENKLFNDFVNNQAFEYYKNLYKLEDYISSANPKIDVINKHFDNLIKESDKLSTNLLSLMKQSKFELGKEFQFSENFIEEYESEVQDNG